MNLEWHPFRAKAPMTFSADEYLETGELGLGVLIGFFRGPRGAWGKYEVFHRHTSVCQTKA